MSITDPGLETAEPRRKAPNPRPLFLVIVLIGTISLAIASFIRTPDSIFLKIIYILFTIIVPLVAMAIYIYVGKVRQGNNSIQFADSVYFLGFIFTLVALVLSMYWLKDVRSDDQQALNAFLLRFAVALITTVVGLTARIYIINFRETTEDSLTRAQRALTEAIHNFTIRIDQQSLHLRQHDKALNDLQEKHMKESSATLEAVLKMSKERADKSCDYMDDAMRDTATNVSKVMNAMVSESAETLQQSAARIATALGKTANEIETSLPDIMKAIQNATKEYVDQAKTSFRGSEQVMEDAAKTVQTRTQEYTEQGDRLEEKIRAFQQEAEKIPGLVNKLGAEVEKVITLKHDLREQHEAAQEEFDQVDRYSF